MTLLLILVLMLLPGGRSVENHKTAWLVTSGSTLSIAGTTNVNKFECFSLDYAGQDVLLETRNPHTDRAIISGQVVLKANGFDCRNRIMTQDMQKTIQAKKYPNIKVHFLSLQRSLNPEKNQTARGVIEVCLAGISRQYTIDAVFVATAKDKAQLKGSWEFKFSDFNMEPPTKIGGAIKVRNSLTVNFNLELEAVSNSTYNALTGN